MNMTSTDMTTITLISATAIIVCAVIVAAFAFGVQCGYRERVKEEKEVRGIR